MPVDFLSDKILRFLFVSFLSLYVKLICHPELVSGSLVVKPTIRFYGDFSVGVHLFPFRTEQLSPVAPMVLPSPAGESVAANLF